MHTTSVSLLIRLKRPDADLAWQRFVDLYTPLLFYWARRAGVHPPDDDDLVQDVFALLLRKLPEFEYDPKRSFRGWLRTIVHNQWCDRQRRKLVAGGVAQADDAELEELPDPGGDEEFWEQEHRQRLVARALEVMQAEFEEPTWRACWECVACGRPACEVAAELGISRNAVYVAKCRVLRRLRQELDGML
ncbi:MAG TPA: sigma-70 family RNA polymerase sigma factor [Pirellulales bacterium]